MSYKTKSSRSIQSSFFLLFYFCSPCFDAVPFISFELSYTINYTYIYINLYTYIRTTAINSYEKYIMQIHIFLDLKFVAMPYPNLWLAFCNIRFFIDCKFEYKLKFRIKFKHLVFIIKVQFTHL